MNSNAYTRAAEWRARTWCAREAPVAKDKCRSGSAAGGAACAAWHECRRDVPAAATAPAPGRNQTAASQPMACVAPGQGCCQHRRKAGAVGSRGHAPAARRCPAAPLARAPARQARSCAAASTRRLTRTAHKHRRLACSASASSAAHEMRTSPCAPSAPPCPARPAPASGSPGCCRPAPLAGALARRRGKHWKDASTVTTFRSRRDSVAPPRLGCNFSACACTLRRRAAAPRQRAASAMLLGDAFVAVRLDNACQHGRRTPAPCTPLRDKRAPPVHSVLSTAVPHFARGAVVFACDAHAHTLDTVVV
jgi:hypothetical protein